MTVVEPVVEQVVHQNGGQLPLRRSTTDAHHPVVPLSVEATAAVFEPLVAAEVSAGTATFFTLRLRREVQVEVQGDKNEDTLVSRATSETYWIGKDLSRAEDEAVFYEKASGLFDKRGWTLLAFLFEYGGVVSFAHPKVQKDNGVSFAHTKKDSKDTIELLVMRNLMDSRGCLRMLDVKIGAVTAVEGWYGKSKRSVMLAQFRDKYTNTRVQGFRLEGFLNAPARNPPQTPPLPSRRLRKIWQRMWLQRKPAYSFLADWLDFRFLRAPSSEAVAPDLDPRAAFPGALAARTWPFVERQAVADFRSSCETAELLLWEVVLELWRLVVACAAVPVPQMWVASSIGISFDVALLPLARDKDALDAADFPQVHIFDWGRSELCTEAEFAALPADGQALRTRFWTLYTQGVTRLLYEASRLYVNRFTSTAWEEVRFEVFAYASSLLSS